ncbi:MAG: ribokinase [Verrucomicrobiota bacterium]|jgi:ribokinase|nr:ribokinase [Verrucomicrobiota bacterium]MEC8690752.1 ribokinase [Verrucomicrobiota bacterium]
MSVLVIGSLIVDNTIYVKSLPQPGETIFAKSSLISHGGKGANQALAVHLSGGEVNLMGCVGGDSVGEEYKRYLQEKGVGSDYLMTSLTNRTGSAFITVDDSGENSIIVNSGSNSDLRANHIDENIDIIKTSEIMLLQQEIPASTIQHACMIGKKCGLTIIMNPSPLKPSFDIKQFPCDILILNEIEAQQLSGKDNPIESFEVFDSFGVETVIITRGAQTVLYKHLTDPIKQFQPPKVQAIDTVGAGDTFAGTFAASLLRNESLHNSIQFASVAASISVTKKGAQGAMPTKKEIESFVI